ncbi:MAG: ATPase, T2SS/T4P/T4SS family [Planctomycetota bacterium]
MFDDLDPKVDDYAVRVVDRLLGRALEAAVSDIHVSQRQGQIAIRWRVHGTLVPVAEIADGESTSILNRIKAAAKLVTYRSDIPQEGSLRLRSQASTTDASGPTVWEARVSTLPTLHGERAVVRLQPSQQKVRKLAELGLEASLHERILQTLKLPSGVMVIAGRSGSGKTTTGYACLDMILSSAQLRSVVTLEDPVECEMSGADQSEIGRAQEYDWTMGLKALLRQDPEVMFVGEIRDAETATTVFQAAMTGQLVITTLHARSSCDALRRLLDLGVPSQHIIASLNLLFCQQLVAIPCECPPPMGATALENRIQCDDCHGTMVRGRKLVTEQLPELSDSLAALIGSGADTKQFQHAAIAEGMIPLQQTIDHLDSNNAAH